MPWFRILVAGEDGPFDRGKLEPAVELWHCDALAPGSFRPAGASLVPPSPDALRRRFAQDWTAFAPRGDVRVSPS